MGHVLVGRESATEWFADSICEAMKSSSVHDDRYESREGPGRKKRRPPVQIRRVGFWVLWCLVAGLVAVGVQSVLRPQSPPFKPPIVPFESPATQKKPFVRGRESARPTARASVAPKTESTTETTPRSAPESAPESAPKSEDTGKASTTSATLDSQTPPAREQRAIPTPAAQAAWRQDRENIDFAIRAYSAQVRACYERAVSRLPNESEAPEGRLVVLFVLTDEGHAIDGVISEDSVGLPVLRTCLLARLAEWRFSRPVGSLRTFQFPFVFTRREQLPQ